VCQHAVDNYVITINFILSTTAEEISDVFLTQRTQVLRQWFSTLQRLHLMLNRRREWIVHGFKNIGFAASIVVRGADVITGESITSFDVCRINLCDSLNAWSTKVSSRFLFILLRITSFWANDVLTFTSSLRGSSFIACMLELSTIFCSGSMISLKWFFFAIFFDFASLQNAMFFYGSTRPFFQFLLPNLLTLVYIFVLSHVDVLSTLGCIDND